MNLQKFLNKQTKSQILSLKETHKVKGGNGMILIWPGAGNKIKNASRPQFTKITKFIKSFIMRQTSSNQEVFFNPFTRANVQKELNNLTSLLWPYQNPTELLDMKNQ